MGERDISRRSGHLVSLSGRQLLDSLLRTPLPPIKSRMRDGLAQLRDCRAEFAELREATARLADGAWSVPPPHLRETVMAGIANTRQLPPEQAARPSATGSSRRVRLGAAAAALVAAAGTGSLVYAVQDHRVDQQRRLTEAAQAGEARVRAVDGLPNSPEVGVTIEPTPGSPTPAAPLQALVKLT
ncbi:hypothetical protein M1L60_33975 [Actinoplanes sp. TRM 88003]|uniref:Anti-sigma factor n=1 Tax=Paractinoplanes aksuensis TaxID=2939490 RepID=A0ABT1E0A3_9ACTN|nr:hypothetical protein [Actinoplanes aksuensis]MCO8275605.1 hypothetical protein [Actinoplanes aksuensis]